MTDTTNTELEAQESVAPTEVKYLEQVEYASNDLLEFSRNMHIVYAFACSLVQTPFVPQQYQRNPGNATAAIMAARGVGIKDPMAALRAIDVIQGTPAFRANTLRGLAQAAGHEIWVEESTTQRAIVAGRRKGDDRVQQSEWDLDRARNLQLTSKDNWKKQPKAMLLARATSELVRLIASDMLMGLYAAEELEDGSVVPESAAEAEKPKPKRATIQRKKPAQALKEQAEREAQEPTEEPETPAPSEDATPTDSAPEAGAEPLQDADAPMALIAPDQGEEPFTGDPGQPTKEELAEWAQMPEGFS
ncbi:hypothetical protein [Pseudoclavibacter sp. AY1H1]|uniref:hypothetical protein n=1 Tax=Pseudoclavibacter sp. AY1H1 TaxID=2080584 RepID=UPI000CE76769|nr:hypothetical protein [Pseudoclavibacter sp. AY1H1]PPF38368.1 hypothetical protein C5E05_04975 [Pseudoclavibacter sp. AY1H1]